MALTNDNKISAKISLLRTHGITREKSMIVKDLMMKFGIINKLILDIITE